MDDTSEVERRNLDVLYIRVEELEEIVRCGGLLTVLHANSELVRIGRREVECKRVIITHCLDELEEVNHVDTENMLCRAKVVLKAVAM